MHESWAKRGMKELESIWRKNRLSMPRYKHPQGLRGPDVMSALREWFCLTEDFRFVGALAALIEHGIVDRDTLEFCRSPETNDRKFERQEDARKLFLVQQYIELQGVTVSMACATVAAHLGHHAASFEAAIKDLRKKYKHSPARHILERANASEQLLRDYLRYQRAAMTFDELVGKLPLTSIP